jgi:hypothetical protein
MFESGGPDDGVQPDGLLVPLEEVIGWDEVEPLADVAAAAECLADDVEERGADSDGGALTAALLELAAVAAADDLEQTAADEELADLDAAAALDRLSRTAMQANAVLVDQLRLVAHWADLHGHVKYGGVPGAERLVSLGGDGTPEVAEFAAAEMGVALRVSTAAASHLLADVLDLRHRFPALWLRTVSEEVLVPIARRVAEDTHRLSADAAAGVDQRIAELAGSLTWRRLSRIVRAAVLAADPEQARSAAERAAAEAGVWVDDETAIVDGYGTLIAKASAGDLAAFNHAVGVVANALRLLGDPGTLQQRRSRALGILARPRQALDLVERANQLHKQPQPDQPSQLSSGPEESSSGAEESPVLDRRRVLDFQHVLYFHLSRDAVQAMLSGRPGGVGRLEDLGPVIAEQIQRWLGHSSVIVRPVIDPDTMPAVDCWEVPPRMSEAVRLRRPADYFPWSSCTSRHQDNEHPKPYVPVDRGGPPGQTSVQTLARITRFHHRVKTHGGWTVTAVKTDNWLWRSPTGHYSLVNPTGTTTLGRLS